MSEKAKIVQISAKSEKFTFFAKFSVLLEVILGFG